MSKIDRGKAPDGATHFDPNPYDPVWMRRNHRPGRGWDWWGPSGENWIHLGDLSTASEARLIELAESAHEWNGEGLPSVGISVEVCHVGHDDWHARTINYIGGPNGLVVFKGDVDEEFGCPVRSCKFRPIRTPEQIAAEERERQLDQMVSAAGMLDKFWARKVAERLYEAGYRKAE